LNHPSIPAKADKNMLCHLAKNYVITSDILYHRGVDSILRHCLTLEEAKLVLNDFHSAACGGHLSGLAIAQKILRTCYFWSSIFKDYIEAVKCFHPCQVYAQKMHMHPAPLFPVIIVGPFMKWGIYVTTCNPPLARKHKYIILEVNYITKWA